MELEVVDRFVYPDLPVRGAGRAADSAAVSFADVLDASAREFEPMPRARDGADVRPVARADTAQARVDDAPNAKAEERKPEIPPGQAKAKPKSESAKPDVDAAPAATPTETAAADTPTETAPVDSPPENALQGEVKGKGAAALDWLANLLATANATVDPTTPKGQMVAAIVVPQNVPEHAAAAANQNIPSLVPAAPVTPPQLTPTTPGDAAPTATPLAPDMMPAPAPAVFEPAGDAPAAAPSPTGAATNAAAPLLVPSTDTAEVSTAPVSAASASAPAPAPNVTPAVPAATADAPAHEALVTPTTATLPIEALVAEMIEEPEPLVLDAPTADDVVTPLGATPSAATTTVRPTAGQTSVSGYVAQMVSQETSGTESPAVSQIPADGENGPVPTRDANLVPADAPAADELPAPAKAADGMPLAAADASNTREAHSVENIAAMRSGRPAALPLPEQVVVRIAKAVADGVDRINVKLSPADLGHIDVRMEIGPDGRFQAVFAADRPQTVELLQRDARELARALQDAGLRADTGSLSFNLRGQGQQGNADAAPARTGSLPMAAGGGDLPSEVAPQHAYRAPGLGAGRVDIRV